MVLVKQKEEIQLLSVGLFTLFALSIIVGLVCREPWLWMDEVLSYVFVSDPSFTHMNSAVISSMDQNPPLFFNLYWLIGHTINLDPLFLRIISVLLFAATISLFFLYTTRLIGDPATNFVLISVMVYMTYQNFAHATGIRQYALLFPLCCVYFILLQQLIGRPASKRLLIFQTFVGMMIAFCHNYGLFYLAASGAFFLGLLLWSKNRHYLLPMATHGLIAIVWLVGWYPNFVIQSQAGNPHSWIPFPTIQSFFGAFGDLIPGLPIKVTGFDYSSWFPIAQVVLVVGLFVYLALPMLKAGFQTIRHDPARQFFLLSGFIYLTTMLIALIVSLFHTPILLGRYMWPSQLLIMYQLVYTYYHFAGQRRILPQLGWLLLAYSLLLSGVIFYKVSKMESPFPSQILTYLPQLKPEYPVFVERADYFLPIWFHKKRSNISFLLDWKTADWPDNIKSATVNYKVLQTMKETYNVSGIVPVNQFNADRYPRFYVVDEQDVYQIEHFIKTGHVKVIRELPIAMSGHRLLECAF
ncbi:hypothetical protein [Spirosoma oryzicola]|uniref:hypothetical protein n=1 Tax=Spirosoma oryzicola TaxID=2898794 RepID=UPI001E2DDF1F|nr:hypothetical protein [Spirosoma oryzicola]UHG90350.1 hypothetical protein LQ777_19115 [Spirosoma oryzicola]